jgi:hypothetical protein
MKTQPWHRHLFYSREVVRTTWKLRLALLVLIALSVYGTGSFWLPLIGKSLICDSRPKSVDVIVIDNLESDYLAFELAGQFVAEGLGQHVLVPVQVGRNGRDPNLISRRFVEVMSEVAGLGSPEMVGVRHTEPFSLNVARQVRERLRENSIESILVVSPLFRSKRTGLIYQSVFGPLGIQVYCVPTRQSRNASNWWKTSHGVQNVVLEFMKLQYYRFFVL